jgi:hypothetical protein
MIALLAASLGRTLVWLAVQLILGWGLAALAVVLAGPIAALRRSSDSARRGGRAARVGRLRVLSRGLPFALVGAVAGRLLEWGVSGGVATAFEPLSAGFPGLVTLTGAVGTSSVWRLLDAGRSEARGALRPARRAARHAGKRTFLACDLLLVLVLLAVLGRSEPVSAAVSRSGPAAVAALLGGSAVVAAAGFVALLAGLSAKPRPSGQVAALLYALGWWLLVAAVDPR